MSGLTKAQQREGRSGAQVRGISPRLAVCILLTAGGLAYLNSFSVPFIFDDSVAISENPTIRHLWPVWPALWAAPDTANAGRPVVNYSFALNFAMSGLRLWSYHAVNLAIHLAAASALFGIVRRTLDSARFAESTRSRATAAALAASLIWALHPIQTQSVTYLTARNESLMGMFYLASLYCFIRGNELPGGAAWRAASVIACVLGMGSKEVMVSAPITILLYDWIFVAGSWREMVNRRALYYASLASCWILLAAIVFGAPRTQTTGFGLAGLDPISYARTQAGVLLHYLRLVFWPHPLVFDYYDWPPVQNWAGAIPQGPIILALLAVSAVLVVRRNPLGFPAAFFFLVLAPSSSFMPIREIAWEYRMYLPLAGVIVLAGTGFNRGARFLYDRLGIRDLWAFRVNCAAVASVVLALAAATITRNRDYQSPIRLYEKSIRCRPKNVRLQHNLAVLLMAEGRKDEALKRLDEALEINPANPDSHANLGVALNETGQKGKAESEFRAALALDPDHASAHDHLGDLLADKGEKREAVEHFRKAIKIKPYYAEAHNNLGSVLADLGSLEEAKIELLRAIELKPDYAHAHNNLGTVLGQLGDREGAIREFTAALELDPEYAAARQNLEITRGLSGSK